MPKYIGWQSYYTLSFILGCDKIYCLQRYFPIALDDVCSSHHGTTWIQAQRISARPVQEDETGQLQTERPAETNRGAMAISLAWT